MRFRLGGLLGFDGVFADGGRRLVRPLPHQAPRGLRADGMLCSRRESLRGARASRRAGPGRGGSVALYDVRRSSADSGS